MKDTNDTQVEEPIAVPFEREDRYIVLKIKDLEMLNPVLLEELTGTLSAIANLTTMPRREYVVVESDWPEYETVWKMLEERVNWERAFKLGSKHPTNDTQGPEVVAWQSDTDPYSFIGTAEKENNTFQFKEEFLASHKKPLMLVQSHQEAERQANYWQEEARRYASNADFWRDKCDKKDAALLAYEDQNSKLKRALVRWREKQWPGTDQSAVVEREYPAITQAREASK